MGQAGFNPGAERGNAGLNPLPRRVHKDAAHDGA